MRHHQRHYWPEKIHTAGMKAEKDGGWFYDEQRLSEEEAKAVSKWNALQLFLNAAFDLCVVLVDQWWKAGRQKNKEPLKQIQSAMLSFGSPQNMWRKWWIWLKNFIRAVIENLFKIRKRFTAKTSLFYYLFKLNLKVLKSSPGICNFFTI